MGGGWREEGGRMEGWWRRRGREGEGRVEGGEGEGEGGGWREGGGKLEGSWKEDGRRAEKKHTCTTVLVSNSLTATCMLQQPPMCCNSK